MKKIPLTLITGFLGAGKSTLVNRIIAEHPHRHFGIVVNEFGDANIESQMINQGESIAELPNGCMCCVARSDLVDAVSGLLARFPAIDHVILEASGLSDPVPIAATFLDDDLDGRVRLDSIVSVVDCAGFQERLEDFPIAAQQILFADFVLLSKLDLCDEWCLRNSIAMLKPLRPRGDFYELDADFSTSLFIDPTAGDGSDLRELEITARRFRPVQAAGMGRTAARKPMIAGGQLQHHHEEELSTVFYKARNRINPARFQAFLASPPPTLIRAKGYIAFDAPGHGDFKHILQVVGRRVDLQGKRWKPGEARQSALVMIGSNLDGPEIVRRLQKCECQAGD